MYNSWPILRILLLSNPIALESRQSRQNRASNPNRKLSFPRRENFQINVLWNQIEHFLIQSFCKRREHCITSRQSYVLEQQRLQVNICLINTINNLLMNTINIHTNHLRLKHHLWCPNAQISNFYLSPIGQFKVLKFALIFQKLVFFLIKVHRGVAAFFLYFLSDFLLTGGLKGNPIFCNVFLKVFRKVPSSQVHSRNGLVY